MSETPSAARPLAPDAAATLDRAFVTTFLAHVADFVHFKDREGRFLAVSDSKLRRNGLTQHNEIIGMTDFDFFSEADARKAQADEDEVMRTGLPMVSKLQYVKGADGRETWSLINKMPLRDEHGTIVGTFGVTRDVTESRLMEIALEKSRRELVDASRLAGMAEVATGVLHNVGNVLNSLNISTTIITAGLRQSKTESLSKVGELLREHAADLGHYVTEDHKGKLVPGFIESLAKHFSENRATLLKESESVQKNVDHIKEIVTMQQSYATTVGVTEPLESSTLMEDALRLNSSALVRHDIRVVREFGAAPRVLADRGKVLQIIVNLISNAKHAAENSQQTEKIITLRIVAGAPGRVRLSVQDNGVGILAENLDRVFTHGFTTKATGHGFGLHCSANAAKEMKSSLTVQSAGLGTGATFVLDLPAAPATAPT